MLVGGSSSSASSASPPNPEVPAPAPGAEGRVEAATIARGGVMATVGASWADAGELKVMGEAEAGTTRRAGPGCTGKGR